MAKTLNGLTFGESKNLQVYNAYSYETLTLNEDGSYRQNGEDVATRGWQAKKLMIIPFSGTAGNTITIRMFIKGSSEDSISVLFDDFPITFDNILIDQIQLTNQSSADAVFSVISFGTSN